MFNQSTTSTAVSVIWSPQPGPQTALLACPVFEIFFGGARGGGKTDASIGDWLQHSAAYGENAIGIFFRRKLIQLAEVIARTKQLFPKLGAKYNEQKSTWLMPNGARLKFAYLEKDSDAEEYQGHNYTRVYIEEAPNFPSPSPINLLRATLRSAAGVPTGMRLTGNPGGPGHNWVKARYIDPDPRGYKVIKESTELIMDGKKIFVELDRVFIPSRLTDNNLLITNDPTYVLRLRQSGSEALVKAWLEGDWNIIDGAYFDEFSYDRHVLEASEWEQKIPSHALKFRAFDWGSAKPFSVGWYAVSDGTWGLPFGALVRYREWYGASGPNKGLKMLASTVAEGILNRERQASDHLSYGVADPSIFIRDGGPSIAESMIVQGCGWKKADNRRKAGWEEVHRRLKGDASSDHKPLLYIMSTCEDLIRTLPVLQHDEVDPEDLDTEGEDHAADELRYACMSRPWVKRLPVTQGLSLPKLPSEMKISELIAKRTAARKAAEAS